MSEMSTQITSVRLARDRLRLFVGPMAFVLLAAAAAASGLLLRGPTGIVLVALGGLAALVAAYLAALVTSYRLLVEPGTLTLKWLGGERRYRLVRGPVTRVAVKGPGAAALHPRFGSLGWAVGPAVLRGGESIELIRLSNRPPLIVAPTDRGRLAIAAAVESDLLAAMTHAVRLQERLDQVAARRAAPVIEAPPPRPVAPPAPRVLTGIERTLIEQRLAAERAAAQAAAEAERAGAAAAVVSETPSPVAAVEPAMAAAVEAPAPAVVARVGRRRERSQWQRPTWAAVPGPATVVAALPIALPLIGAGIAWTAVAVTGRPSLPVDEARILLTALVLVGPLGAAAAFIARTWYPRLGGLVMASSVAALAILARTILA
jgi:hypothetical protein